MQGDNKTLVFKLIPTATSVATIIPLAVVASPSVAAKEGAYLVIGCNLSCLIRVF